VNKPQQEHQAAVAMLAAIRSNDHQAAGAANAQREEARR
jgi:hypothetical protein